MWARITLLPILVMFAYWPAHQGGYLWDDDDYVSRNMLLRSGAGLEKIWFEPGATPQYYPLVFTTFWVEFHLWSLDTFGYHLVNIVLHGLSSALLWLILRRLQVPGAWFAAAIFALHPVHVESVAWITERKNVLSGFFYLLAFLAFLRFSPLPSPPGRAPSNGLWREGSWVWCALSLACFVMALLSKTVVCSLPAVLILVYWWKRGVPTRREWAGLIPMFIVGAVMAWNTSRLEKAVVGAYGPDFDITFAERCLIAGRALWFYAEKLVWPYPLIFNYERWTIDAGDLRQWLYPLAAVVVVMILLAGMRKFGRGPLIAWLIFAGTLFPALGFFNVYPMRYSFVADHFQYLASIALIVLFVAGAHGLGQKLRLRPWMGFVAGCLLLGLLGRLTWLQCQDYAYAEILWRNTAAKNLNSFLAHLHLGMLRMGEQKYIEAIPHFERSAKANPRYAPAFNNWGDCLIRMGLVYKARADEADAEAKRLQSLGIDWKVAGKFAEANAFKQEARKLFTGAAEKARIALDLEDDDPRRYNNLALIYVLLEDYDAAVPLAEKALALAPEFKRYDRRRFDFKKGYPQAEYNLGLSLYKLDRLQEALPHLRRAAELDPNSELYEYMLKEAEGKK